MLKYFDTRNSYAYLITNLHDELETLVIREEYNMDVEFPSKLNIF